MPLEAGDVVVVHSAAGGVGLLLTQMASARGLRVVGTTSTEAKAELAAGAGASDVVVRARGTSARSFGPRVRGSVPGSSSTRSARTRSRTASSRSPGAAPSWCSASRAGPCRRSTSADCNPGSVFLTRPGLADYTSTRDELLERAGAVFSMLASGELDVRVHERFPLARAADAHRALASGTTTGKLLLVTGR